MKNNNKKSMTLTSKNIIKTRDEVSKAIMSNWKYIHKMNLLTKKEAKKFRTMDLKGLYNQITQFAETRIKAKLLLNAINSGEKTIKFEDLKGSHYYNIYKLNELKEQRTQLDILKTKHCMNPAAKAKLGNKNPKEEIFTNQKVSALIKDIDLEIIDLETKIADFNKNAVIEIDSDPEIEKFALAA